MRVEESLESRRMWRRCGDGDDEENELMLDMGLDDRTSPSDGAITAWETTSVAEAMDSVDMSSALMAGGPLSSSISAEVVTAAMSHAISSSSIRECR
jgi:hypothetical protein